MSAVGNRTPASLLKRDADGGGPSSSPNSSASIHSPRATSGALSTPTCPPTAEVSNSTKSENEADSVASLRRQLAKAEKENRRTREELKSQICYLEGLVNVQRKELYEATAPVMGTVLAVRGGPSRVSSVDLLESAIVTDVVTRLPSSLCCCLCDNCGVCLYPGNWFRCNTCDNFDLCYECLKLGGTAHNRAAGAHRFGDMRCVLRTQAGFPSILNLNAKHWKSYKQARCNVCGDPAYFHCNECSDYDLCDKHIVTDLWFTHAAHGIETTFTNLWLSQRVAGV